MRKRINRINHEIRMTTCEIRDKYGNLPSLAVQKYAPFEPAKPEAKSTIKAKATRKAKPYHGARPITSLRNSKGKRVTDLTMLEYRHLARMFAYSFNAEDQGETEQVILNQIKALSREAKYALRSAYIFASKAPKQEREDLFQELFSKCFAARPDNERLAYAITRADWSSWWERQSHKWEVVCLDNGAPQAIHFQHCELRHALSNRPTSCKECAFSGIRAKEYSLDSCVSDSDGKQTTLGTLLVGECEFEIKQGAKQDAQALWNMLPSDLKKSVKSRLMGQLISPSESVRLTEWANKHALKLV